MVRLGQGPVLCSSQCLATLPMLVGRQQVAWCSCRICSTQQSFTWVIIEPPCPLHCIPFSFSLWLTGWHSSMSSVVLLTSFSFSGDSAWASPLEKRFLLGWHPRMLLCCLPNHCLVSWSPYPRGQRLETSQVLKWENIFSVKIFKLNCRIHCFQVPVGFESCPTRRHVQPLETLSQCS